MTLLVLSQLDEIARSKVLTEQVLPYELRQRQIGVDHGPDDLDLGPGPDLDPDLERQSTMTRFPALDPDPALVLVLVLEPKTRMCE